MLLKHTLEPIPDLVCETCGFATKLRRQLKTHIIQKHEVEKHQKCPYCDHSTYLALDWKKHIDKFHPEHDKKKFFCDKCPKRFIFQASFNVHYCKGDPHQKMLNEKRKK